MERISQNVVEAEAEVVVVEERLRKLLRGVAASSPGAIIAGKAVLEREGIRPVPRPQIITVINTGDTHRRRSFTRRAPRRVLPKML